jgi:hypothetical protein
MLHILFIQALFERPDGIIQEKLYIFIPTTSYYSLTSINSLISFDYKSENTFIYHNRTHDKFTSIKQI